MQHIDVSQAQSLLPSLLEAVGIGDVIIITRNEQPIAKLSAANGGTAKQSSRWEPGSAKGIVHIRENFDDPIEGFAEYLP